MEGVYGEIFIVKDFQDIPAENPAETLTLKKLKEKPLHLSKNIWESRTGGKELFSPASEIQDKYSYFIKKSEKDLVLEWKLERSLNDFANEEFTILFDGTKFDVKYLGTKYIKFNLIEEEDKAKLVITEAYKVEDMILLYESITGVDDHAEISSGILGRGEISCLIFVSKLWIFQA